MLIEEWIFYLFVILNAAQYLIFQFNLTMDGPSHLYNANLIKYLVTGDQYHISDFFVINPVPVPNWTGHFIMMILGFLFSGPVTEKIFILLYAFFLPVTFRILVRTISPSHTLLSFLIFPFIRTILFQLGFFNFCIAFIFMFLAIAYWYRTESLVYGKKPRQLTGPVLVLFGLITLTFFSHILVFGFLLTYLVFHSLTRSFYYNTGIKAIAKSFQVRSLILFIAALPAIILSLVFLMKVPLVQTGYPSSKSVLLESIVTLRPLVFFTSGEILYTRIIFYCLSAIFLSAIAWRIWKIASKKEKNGISMVHKRTVWMRGDLFLASSLVILGLYFIYPNNETSGMMTDRLCMIFLMFFLVWLSIQPLPKWFSLLIILIVLTADGFLVNYQYPAVKILNHVAKEIYKASDHVKDGDVLLSFNHSDNWLLNHSAAYVGIEKPIVILDNYEPVTKWFPLVYNKNFKNILIGDKEEIKHIWWRSNTGSPISKTIDDILFIGNFNLILEDTTLKELRNELDLHYNLVYRSDSAFVRLYRFRENSQSVH